MSFQGSLGTLELPEVLGLLAGTAKSGELHVTGNRTAGLAQVAAVQGRVWFDGGRLVAGETDMVDALVALLRLVEGTFTFRPGPAPNSRLSVEGRRRARRRAGPSRGMARGRAGGPVSRGVARAQP